mgnify:CR=1 FL=1
MNILLLAMMLALPAPSPAAELHNCPAPRTIILARCPGPHEITTQRISCMVKRKIDDCAQVAQGEGK